MHATVPALGQGVTQLRHVGKEELKSTVADLTELLLRDVRSSSPATLAEVRQERHEG
jgi:hypothetical protein